MDKNELIRDLFPPYLPTTQELIDKLVSDKIAPLEQSINDRVANFEAEIAADRNILTGLYLQKDELEAEIRPVQEEVTEPSTEESVLV